MDITGIEKIGEIFGHKTLLMDNLRDEHPELFRPDGSMHYDEFERSYRRKYPIQFRLDKNSISVTLKKGDNGGAPVMVLIALAKHLLTINMADDTNANVACRHLSRALVELLNANLEDDK